MRKLFFALFVFCAANTTFCQQSEIPLEPAMPVPGAESAGGNVGDKIGHLLAAAEHLEAAGLNDEAKKIREMAEGQRTPTVLVQVSVVEVPLSKFDQLGVMLIKNVSEGTPNAAKRTQAKSANISNNPNAITGSSLLKEDDRCFSVLKTLINDKEARVISAPMIIAESGRKAVIRLGGESVPIAIKDGIAPEELKKLNTLLEKFKNLGTKIDVTPVVVDKDTVRVSLTGSFAELDEKHSVKVAGATIPGLKTREIATTCDIKNGYVMVMSGLVEQKPTANAPGGEEDFEQSALMCLIKTEIVEPESKMATRPHSSLLLR